MKRNLMFTFGILLCHFNGFSQYLVEIDTAYKNYIGIQTRLIDALPIEISWVHIQNSKFSYQIKSGFVYTKPNDVNDYYLFNYSGKKNNPGFSHQQSMKAVYIKPGILLWKYNDDFGSRYLALNGVIAFSSEKFKLTTDDAIYGTQIKEYTENQAYASCELELQRIFKNGITIGTLCGFKFLHPTSFNSVVTNIEAGSSFSPGQGYGKYFYFNLQLGYHLMLKK